MAAPVFDLYPQGAPPPVEEPNQTEILPSPYDPLAVARVLVGELTEEGQVLLRQWRDEWWRYEGPHWVETEGKALRKYLYERLEHARYLAKQKDGEMEERSWSPDRGKVDKLIDAMVSPTLLERRVEAPCWLDTGESAVGYIACANGLVDVHTQHLLSPTPRYFGLHSVPFSYNPAVGAPVEWLKFLHSLWPAAEDGSEAEEILALQEWFGYVLSGRTDLQKMLLLWGPKRCGKGTIARTLTALLGAHNVAAPTLAGMTTNFGLQPLIGKPLAIVGDARLQAHGQEAVVERLLSITGEDGITIDRKNRDPWTGRLPTRMMILSNQLPKFGDSSGAISSRFVILPLQESFLGREDIELEGRITAELPAILKWGLDGLTRLAGQRRLTEPVSSQEAQQNLADMVSPMSAFLREVCVAGPEEIAPFADVYREYIAWADENGRGKPSTGTFVGDITSVITSLKTDYRPRDANGVKLPRHFKGLSLNPEWLDREKDEFADAARRRGTGW